MLTSCGFREYNALEVYRRFQVPDTDEQFQNNRDPSTQNPSRTNVQDGLWTPDDDNNGEKDVVIEDTSSPEEDKALRAQSIQTFGKFSTIGLHLLFAVLIGYVIGHWMDEKFDIYPVMTLFWIACGLASTILEFIKIVKQAKNLDDKSSQQDDSSSNV